MCIVFKILSKCFVIPPYVTSDLLVKILEFDYQTIILTGYVQDIFDTFLKATKKDLEDAASELNKKSPEPMNSMLEKQPVDLAKAKHKERRDMVIQDVPPTIPGTV